MSDKADGGSKKARQPAKYRVKVYKKTETAKYYGIIIIFTNFAYPPPFTSIFHPYDFTLRNMKTFRIIHFLGAVVCLFAILSCSKTSGDDKFRIGVSQCSDDYWRVRTNDEIKREALFHDDVELLFRSADGDNSRQIDDIRHFINEGCDLIIVSPNESAAITPVVKEAIDKNIPVVTFDRQIDGDGFTAHMEVDNRKLGEAVALYSRASNTGKLNIIELQGPRDASPARLRHAGFAAKADSLPDFNVLASVHADWDDRRAATVTDSLLRIYPQTNMIYAHTDHMGIGAAKAARDLGRDDIKIYGIDGFPHIGIKAVKDSLLTATFLYPSDGEKLLRLALSVLKGEPYQRLTRTPPLPPIDRKNADIILAQEELLEEESSKINSLHDKLIVFDDRYDTQKMLLYASLAILLMLAVLLFISVKAISAHRHHQKALLLKNSQLEEEKAKQNELYEQLKEATQSKLAFFTNVSHDLRTPLTLISAPVKEVAEASYLTPRDKSLMEIARKNVAILRRLIDQILDFRKYENGKTDLSLSEADLPSLLRGWASDFSEAARRRDIHLCCAISPSTHFPMAVDVEKIERIFFNLMSNAFKHTHDNGSIEVSFSSNAESASFFVKDNGSGMAPEQLGRIFDRFYQVDKSGGNGSGIGLALTKAFIELHGGRIEVESEPGKGSVFKVTLPVRHCSDSDARTQSFISPEVIEAELTPVSCEQDTYDADKPVMLVIDDNRDIQSLISALLGDAYNIMVADNGAQGLKMAIKYVPDIIICDVMMPVMDGMECVSLLKGEVTTSHIPVLMLTACTMDEQRTAGFDSGADGYLSKPFSSEVLAAQCRSLLLNRRLIKELYERSASGKPRTSDKDETRRPPRTLPGQIDNDFYDRFVGIVEKNISNADLSIDNIASEIGLSQSQLARKIKAITNYTPVEIIRTLRLQKARTMLRGSDKSVSEIAFEVGFTSLAYFSKCYKKAFGEPPTSARPRGARNLPI